ncbi:helix-turn-helix transcriptional regulator [Agrobacterium leguminum]|uniref:Helix-turn-helix transcriptional regulator n=1 Tax=Agrobacterium leguminum TaxID=2792015 RepID=A0A9X3KGT4_9HYPH|nr:helix-turn-helix transcriptional regulator [Agrobacterium leguminum]MCZ7911505.1 helix-turn-helix transcriptional regulator [Agrobacterium leguminum]
MQTDKIPPTPSICECAEFGADAVVAKLVEISEVTTFAMERHPWGQFVYAYAGAIELKVEGRRYAAPPDYGLWLPRGTEHLAWAVAGTSYALIDVDPRLCETLPTAATAISISPIGKAIFHEVRRRGCLDVERPQIQRLLRVLLDQLSEGTASDNFLPLSEDRFLSRVLEALICDPSDTRSLADWARYVNATERTLARRCLRDLGMTFQGWRQQLRLSRAVAMLSEGRSVRVISEALGYRTPSAFITMFTAAKGCTPTVYRAQLAGT